MVGHIRKVPIDLKKVFFWAAYIFLLLSLPLLVEYIIYARYFNRILQLKNASMVNSPSKDSSSSVGSIDPLTILRLGAVLTDRSSSFANFPEKKNADTIRIGCFGDSFTYGSEARDGYDYPGLLAKIFEAKGYKNIEVINFGMPGYGFHQAFIMWKYVASKYDLDYILLGPQCFQLERDDSFRFPHSLNFSFFHSRYIVNNGGLELVDPLGKDSSERFDYYFKFIPPWRYLRYDFQAPAFLACWLPSGKVMRNPFYYRRDIDKEQLEIYGLMLSEMARDDRQIILGHVSKEMVSLAQGLDFGNILAFRIFVPERFPYLGLKRHYSPSGYRLVAQQMFEALTASIGGSDLNLITTKDIQDSTPSRFDPERKPLHEYDRVLIQMNGNDVGCFLKAQILGSGKFLGLQTGSNETIESGELLHNEKISSLVALKHINKSIVDSIFLPLDVELDDNMPFAMRIETANGKEDYLLGNLRLLNPKLNIGFVDWNSGADLSLRIGTALAENSLDSEYLANCGLIPAGSRAAFFLGGNRISTRVDPLIIRATSYGNVFEEELATEGMIYLGLYSGGDDVLSIPFAEWDLERQPAQYEGKGDPGGFRQIESARN